MLLLGTLNKTPQLLEAVRQPFLLIANTTMAKAFAEQFRDAVPFHHRNHAFEIRRDYDGSRGFADTVFPDKDLMTYRNGRRELTKLLLNNTTPLAELDGDRRNPAVAEALAAVNDVILSPTLSNILTRKPNFRFDRSVIADLSGLYHEDAKLLATLLIGQHKGNIIIPEYARYARLLHMSLVWEGRLTASLNTLSEVDPKLQQALLTIPEKYGAGCVYQDAVVLARYAHLQPDPLRQDSDYNAFIRRAMSTLPQAS